MSVKAKAKTKFAVGDFIRNINPYDGEPEYLIVEIRYEQKEYRTKTIYGPTFNKFASAMIDFEDEDCYEKVG